MLLGQLIAMKYLDGANFWKVMFVVGALPAFLCVFLQIKLKEPEAWVKARQEGKVTGVKFGSYKSLFSDPRWLRHSIFGMMLCVAGVIGIWGIGFFSFDLISSVLDKTFRGQGLSEAEIAGRKTVWTGITSLLQNLGAFFGIYAFTYLTAITGRRKAFALSFLAAMATTAYTFWNLKDFSDIFWMIPLMGFSQLALFGGYAIYLPELFPTRLRSTGTSFCYNVGRFVAALGPLALGLLTSRVYAGQPEPMRYAGVTMCAVFLVGLAALPFAPETKGKPLPE